MEIIPKPTRIKGLKGNVKELQSRYYGLRHRKGVIDLYPDYNRGNIDIDDLNQDLFLDRNGIVLTKRHLSPNHQYYEQRTDILDEENRVLVRSRLPIIYSESSSFGTNYYTYENDRFTGTKYIGINSNIEETSQVLYTEREINQKIIRQEDENPLIRTIYLRSDGKKELYRRFYGEDICEEVFFTYEDDKLASYQIYNYYDQGEKALEATVRLDSMGRIIESSKNAFCYFLKNWRWHNFSYEYLEDGLLEKCSGNIMLGQVYNQSLEFVQNDAYDEITFLYDLDSEGNWIKRYHFYDGVLKYITKRKIVYY